MYHIEIVENKKKKMIFNIFKTSTSCYMIIHSYESNKYVKSDDIRDTLNFYSKNFVY